jgi:hypothetical protein
MIKISCDKLAGSTMYYRTDEGVPGHCFLTESQLQQRVLFADGVAWGIVEYPYPREWESLIVHVCQRGQIGDDAPEWMFPIPMLRGYTECFRCKDTCPSSVLTLWKLQNMDAIAIVGDVS